MTTIELNGRITESGELEVKLPPGLPSGDVHVSIEFPENAANPEDLPWELRPWTEDEIREFLKFGQAKTGAEIAAKLQENSGWWENQGISDSVAWLEELRRQEAERRKC
jgi:hypothetical protein